MIAQLELRNFRRFERHTVPLRPTTLIVGPNNAGKSTLVEALRLVAILASRYRSLRFRDAPQWLDDEDAAAGVSPSLEGSGIDLSTVTHQYAAPPAVIIATFSAQQSIQIFLGADGEVHASVRDANGARVLTRQQAHRVALPTVATQPQVAPVPRDERLLAPETVRRNLSSTLAPMHFRNQLWLYKNEYFRAFCAIAEETWPGFAVTDLVREGDASTPEPQLRLLVRNGPFVGELATMGHGLQMWLQTIWFLVRTSGTATVILDEPDVYMHPDLQHRLIRFLRGRYPQLLVATHSADIMSEVEPDEVLVVTGERRRSSFANSPEGVQTAIERMGGVHNLQLAKLAGANRCLFVEGKDIDILKRFQDSLFPSTLHPLMALPHMPVGGWSGWPYAVGSAMFLRNAAGQRIRVYCILDSDYHTPDEIAERVTEATRADVDLHIWLRKEIENYLLVPSAIQRLIANRAGRRTAVPSVEEIAARIDEIATATRDDVTDRFATEFHARDRGAGLAAANRAARRLVAAAWQDSEGRLARGPGKSVLGALSQWSKAEFGVSFGATGVASALRPNEIPDEVRVLLTAIEHNQPVT